MDILHTALGFGGILLEESIAYIRNHFEARSLKAGGEFLGLGMIAHEIAFLHKGIMRVYALDADGSEVTKYFIRQNQFAVNLESYYNLAPSEVILEAITETEILVINRNTWNSLTEQIPKLYILTKSLGCVLKCMVGYFFLPRPIFSNDTNDIKAFCKKQ